MKLHLPSQHFRAVMACFASAAFSSSAFADVPPGYTQVNITSSSQLSEYTSTGYIAFIIGADITDSEYRMVGSPQYWGDQELQTHVLTFTGLESTESSAYAAYGGALKTYELTAEFFKEFLFLGNNSSAVGGAIYSNTITLNDNGSVVFSRNSSASATFDRGGGAICSGDYGSISLTGNGSVEFSGNSASSIGGAIRGGNYGIISLTSNESVEFSGNSASSIGGAIYASGTLNLSENGTVMFNENTASSGGAISGGYTSSTITLSYNESVTFNGNSTSSSGGAISGGYTSSTITLSYNESVIFSGNSASPNSGGAIWGGDASTITLSNNGSVTFSGNSAGYGGAIESSAAFTLSNNESVEFSGNSASLGFGGAIESSAAFTLSNNESVEFSGNSASISGGAIESSAAFTLSDNGNVTFSENSASGGGAIDAMYSGAITLSDNESVMFRGNFSSYGGGAISASYSGTITLSNNKSVSFRGNSASTFGGAIRGGDASTIGTISLTGNGSVTFNGNTASSGGAIYASYSSPITLSNNSSVTFSGNSAGYGGAIYGSSSTITFSGNGHVEFRGNYEISGSGNSATYRLRSVYGYSSSINLSAGADQDIVFYDTLWAFSSTVSFNAKYVDKDGVEQEATGDIVFSGAHAEEDLKKVKPYHTQQELTNSLTTLVLTTTNLYGGTLRIEDGAIYQGHSINVAEGSNAKLRLSKGTLNQSAYDIALNSSTALEIVGTSNNIYARTVLLKDGSEMVLSTGAELNMNDTLHLSAKSTRNGVVSDGVEIKNGRISGVDGKGFWENIDMSTFANYTIANMSISGSLIDVGEDTKLYLVNVDIHSDTHITDEAAWLDMQATNAWLDENNAHVMGRHVTTEDTTLYLSGDPNQAITMAAGRVVVELTSDMFDTVTMTGGEPGVDLWLDMTAIVDAFEGADYVALDFRDLAREFSNAMVDVEKLQVNVTLDGETYKQAYAMTDHGTTTTLYFSVPEPTTSTLSLLALAALAARRRRAL